jgi:hypothetical protein
MDSKKTASLIIATLFIIAGLLLWVAGFNNAIDIHLHDTTYIFTWYALFLILFTPICFMFMVPWAALTRFRLVGINIGLLLTFLAGTIILYYVIQYHVLSLAKIQSLYTSQNIPLDQRNIDRWVQEQRSAITWLISTAVFLVILSLMLAVRTYLLLKNSRRIHLKP